MSAIVHTRDWSLFQQRVDHLTPMGAVPSCVICLVPPVNEKSHCVQSRQAGKPQSELLSDPFGSPCHPPVKTPAVIRGSPWRFLQF